ncbi:hypothetical protein F511_45553 [Dorcoceras hygrometricum]|uniref:Pathogen-related protein-like n=1 Tax=Dorcoceras hygrometricum TaxID=472368 RepID=A0A2Z7A2W2_9LAMI|nr:hypothetical protein F511_45553 [Dorcoceras hygrometricum]
MAKELETRKLAIAADKYRSFLHDEAQNTTEWRHGGPPIYDAVNKLFEEGRSKEWAKGSLEEVVQNAIKSWEMELSHKTRIEDFKTINPQKFKLIVNGKYRHHHQHRSSDKHHEIFFFFFCKIFIKISF